MSFFPGEKESGKNSEKFSLPIECSPVYDNKLHLAAMILIGRLEVLVSVKPPLN